ncbi:hypothetical protein ACGFJ7_45430 [Actinoplanes sp. NPDC048988]|uniref:hypothetical protein n=1 Tax=Actinoplanes sp. NPDC048988 TaxID=3363901 RepID=UPI003712950E
MRGSDEADRVAAGGRSGDPGLDHLLDAVRAPATTAETRGEREVAAALAVERRRAMAGRRRAARPRAVIVGVAAAVLVLGAGGTAVAARTGNLPGGVQRQAHRLFSGWGVPPVEAPTPVPVAPGPRPTASVSPSPAASESPSPAASVSPSPPASVSSSPAASPSPSPSPSPSVAASPSPSVAAADRVAWCTAWKVDAAGGHPMNGRDRRDLIAAAGGKENVTDYCAGVPEPSPSATVKTKPSHPGKDK